MADRLIAEPTNESNPDIIKRLTLRNARSLIFEAEHISRYSDPFTSLPRKFKDARAIKERDIEIANRAKYLEEKEYPERRETRIAITVFSCVFLILGAWLFLIRKAKSIEGTLGGGTSLLMALAPIVVFSITLGVSYLIHKLRENRSKVDMIHARDFDMRDVCADGAYKLMYVHEDVMRLSKRMLDYERSYLYGLNFYNLSHAYDSYTDMLVFVLANKDPLSDELRKDYAQSLLKRALKLKQKLEEIDGIISEKAEYVNEMLRESQRAEQEFVDNRARSLMPIDDD